MHLQGYLPSFLNKKLCVVFVLCLSEALFAIVNGQAMDPLQNSDIVRLLLSPEKLKSLDFPNGKLQRLGRCSGVAISDSLVLTAGHCVIGDRGVVYRSLILARETSPDDFEYILNEVSWTRFESEPLKAEKVNSLVPGCTAKIQPVINRKTADLAIIRFPKNTFKKWRKLKSPQQAVQIGDSVSYVGFGTHANSFVSSMPFMLPNVRDMRKGSSVVWRMNQHAFSTLSTPTSNFADVGDSGGPAFHKDEVVGVMSLLEEKCETELGEDYGLKNTFTLVNTPEAVQFFKEVHELNLDFERKLQLQ